MENQQRKVVVITGASTGIGMATAARLAEGGVRTVLFARGKKDLEAAASSIPSSRAVTGDVTQTVDVERLFETVRSEFGRLDGLFVNAGIAEFSNLQEASLNQYERLFDTNVKGAFLTIKHAVPLMSQGSSVVFNTSVAADIGAPWCSLYGASKGAVHALARNLAAELLPQGIRVNIVSPGPTETPILSKSAVNELGMTEMSPYVMARMRMGRLGRPEEVAAAVEFLLSDRSSFIVGQRLAVDGGMSGL